MFVARHGRAGFITALFLLLSVLLPQSGAFAQTITNISPTSGPIGTVVTATGSGLNVYVNGSVDVYDAQNYTIVATVPITSATSSTLQFAIPNNATVGRTLAFDIYDSGGGWMTALPQTFTVTAASPPTISASFSPNSVTVGSTSFLTLTIANPTGSAMTGVAVGASPLPANLTGSNLGTNCGGTASYSAGSGIALTGASLAANSSCIITLNVTPQAAGTFSYTTGTVSASGPVSVTGSTATSNTLSATSPAPAVTAVSPSAGPTVGGTSVVLTGSNFTGATGVTFGSTAASSFTVNSATQITATAPAGTAGTVDVRVTTSGGTSATSAADQYTYIGAPTVSALAPNSGPTAGGTTVVITGTNLSGATGVTFGGSAASGFAVNSATQITATAPAGSGTVNVRVTTVGGTSATSASNQYTYGAAPTISPFTFGSIVAYNPGGGLSEFIDAAVGGNVTNSPTSFAVGSATTANGGNVSINSSGLATYTPPVGFRGNDTFTVTATNSFGTSSPATVTVVVGNPTLTFSLTGSGTRGTPLSGTAVSVSDGAAPYSCNTTLASGSLPSGVSLNANCSLSGTPAASGSFSFTVMATDSSTGTGPFSQTSGTLTLNVAAPSLSLSPAAGALPGATAGTAYSQTFTTSGGTTSYYYAITAGALPQGMTMSSGGVLSGTPTGTGTYNFTVTVTDSSSAGSGGPYTVSSAYSLTVSAPTITMSPTTLTAPIYNQAYSQGITASGGTAPYSYAVTAGALPAGISLSSSTGTLSGTTTSPGSYNFSISATDSSTGVGAPFTGTRVYTFTVGAPPAAPTVITPANGATVSTALPTLSGTAPASVTVTIIADGAPVGTTTSSAGGTWSFTLPSPLSDGSHTVAAYATDGGVQGPDSATNSFRVDTTAPAAPAIMSPANGATLYQAPTVTGTAEPNSTVTVFVDGSAVGTTAANGAGTFSYTTSTTGAGAHTASATASDAAGNTSPSSATVSFTIGTAPVANAVSISVGYESANNPVTLNITGGTATSVAVAAAPAHGTASVNGTAITYTPAAGYYGPDSFTYTATNGGGTSAPATVSVTVSTPGAPTAADRAGIAVAYNSTGTAIDLSASVTGVHASIAVGTAPAHGTTSISGDVVTYTPAAGYYGADSFTYTATGPGGTSAPAMVSLTVATPGAPTATNRSGVAVAYNSTGTAIDLSASVTGVHASIALGTAPAHGTASIASDVVTYTPAAGYYGADSFTYTATGPGGTSAPAMVSLTVATPPAPVSTASAETVRATADASSQVDVDLSALVSGQFTSIQIVQQPQHGVVQLQQRGGAQAGQRQQSAATVATYVPNPGYAGPDSFSWVAVGPGGTSAPASVSITVIGTPPTAAAKSGTASDGQTVSFDLTDGAGEGPFTSATIVSISPANAAQTAIVASGSGADRRYRLDVTPAARFDGAIVIRYTLSNAFGTSEPATVTVTVNARPDPRSDPTVAALSDSQAEAARRFARTQTGNFMRRNEQLHGGGDGRASMGIQLSSTDGIRDNMPKFSAQDPLNLVDRAPSDADRSASRLGNHAAANGDADTLGTAGHGAQGPRRIGQLAVWTSGTIDIGTVDRTTGREKVSLSSGGLSAGIDVRLTPTLVVGLGGGFGNEVSKIGGGAARVRAQNSVATVYGSYSVPQGSFIDFVLGYGGLDYQTRRNVAQTGAVALGSRNGDMQFASVSTGLEKATGKIRWSLYGRGEYLGAKLDAYAETGAGRYDLRFASRSIKSVSGVLGGRAETTRTTLLGPITPHVRAELTHEFADADPQWLDYADITGTPAYSLTTRSWSRDHFELSFGTALDMGNRWGLDFELGVAGGGEQTNGRMKVQLSKDF